MKVQGLDGREYHWKLSKYFGKKSNNSSKLHEIARVLLKNKFPVHIILEEVTLPGSSRKKSLSADFVIIDLNLIVEVHGEQHYKFNNFYYKDMTEFYQAIRRDRDKKNWAELNNLRLVVLPYNKIDKWGELINDGYAA